ncbi:MAG: hypothetical protein NTZ44_02965 [Candidatus Nomurabacteria bacterium]|nr:hypothetical protein [Candidatus Nomurabacteria bacterium]
MFVKKVRKFGGHIVDGAEPVKRVSEVLIEGSDEITINVFSAMGKTTNALILLTTASQSDDTTLVEKIKNELKSFHLGVAAELFEEGHQIFFDIENIFKDIDRTLKRFHFDSFKIAKDQVLPYGESLTTLIVSEYLNSIQVSNRLVHATNFLMTDASYGNANIDRGMSAKLLESRLKALPKDVTIVITEGFVGLNYESAGLSHHWNETHTTTFDRDGSDRTAFEIAIQTKAENVSIYKDVPGVMDSDPKKNPNAKLLPELSVSEFEQLQKTGATGQFLQKRCIDVIKEGTFTVAFYDFSNLSVPGTILTR